MSSRVVYMAGQWVPEAEARVSIYDLSVMQAAAAFEMTRSFRGVTFRLSEHIERLANSCTLLGIDLPLSTPEIIVLCHEVQERNQPAMQPDDEHRLLIVVSPGAAPIYHEIDGVQKSSWLYIADFPLRFTVQGMGKYFTEGVHCVTSQIQQVPDACVSSQAKHRSRLHFHLAQQQAPAGTWPLMQWMDIDGTTWYAEAPGANLVTVQNGGAYFSPYHALPGISLETVRALTMAGISQPRYTFSSADELWLTGTPFCMLPVVSLDGQPIGNGKIGPVYKQTLAKWSESVGVDIAAQIQAWDGASVCR